MLDKGLMDPRQVLIFKKFYIISLYLYICWTLTDWFDLIWSIHIVFVCNFKIPVVQKSLCRPQCCCQSIFDVCLHTYTFLHRIKTANQIVNAIYRCSDFVSFFSLLYVILNYYFEHFFFIRTVDVLLYIYLYIFDVVTNCELKNLKKRTNQCCDCGTLKFNWMRNNFFSIIGYILLTVNDSNESEKL